MSTLDTIPEEEVHDRYDPLKPNEFEQVRFSSMNFFSSFFLLTSICSILRLEVGDQSLQNMVQGEMNGEIETEIIVTETEIEIIIGTEIEIGTGIGEALFRYLQTRSPRRVLSLQFPLLSYYYW